MNRILIAILLSFCILTGNSQNNRDGNWDGFQRINTETKSGGIVGIFKQFSPVDEQWITLNFLDEKKEYIVKLAPTGEIVTRGTGSEFRRKGFKVVFKEEVQGELFEVNQTQ